ncbi:MAG: hypothetical protein Q8S96_09705 [Hydrogenophaga sp.]|uniref:hypothetical protein n=1 Tax=Hydrogenophaga sp. TaxID=1904254 RepID=UPI00271781CB|nr:hypothetical protein [Hydrogenophaga sp.]MDO9482964.1 hypothetical protein [Hydrogenophaga sp.]MDP3344716.1 hypothetical protein [Hydrogenophaga sp.]MDP3808106.1 hypothetical protein [Hydrogenophaga sp.]MDP3924267.1 hypothetical protein [Hydrogenophaga sp.]
MSTSDFAPLLALWPAPAPDHARTDYAAWRLLRSPRGRWVACYQAYIVPGLSGAAARAARSALPRAV